MVVCGVATTGMAQSGAIDLKSEFPIAQNSCFEYLAGDAAPIKALSRNGYRVKARGKRVRAYKASSKSIPRGRRTSIEVVVGKSARKACEIHVWAAPGRLADQLHADFMSRVLLKGFVPLPKRGLGNQRFAKDGHQFTFFGVRKKGTPLVSWTMSRVK